MPGEYDLKMNPISELRPSPIAGLWYEDNPDRLAEQIDSYLDQAVIPQLNGEVLAVIAPHAGHRYSGRTAGHAFRTVLGKQVDLVAVVSPMHQYYPATLLTSSHEGYNTPLGPVWIDHDLLRHMDQILREDYNLGLISISNDHEHSLEIELPFLQRALQPGYKLLPIMVRSQSAKVARPLGSVLAEVLKGRSVLLVASSDLSHFYPLEAADQLDAALLQQVADFSPDGVIKAEHTGSGFACGAAAIAAVLWAARELGGNHVEILHHSTSAEESGDVQAVVGYGAAVVLQQTT
jgi:MEMO1 family protein